MAKRASIIFIIWLNLFFPGLTWGTLYYYSGTMDSTFEIDDRYVIVVPGGLTSLTFIVTLPEDYSLPNNTQYITELNFTYTGTPSVEDYTDIYESHYRKFIWTNPPKGTINVSISYTVSTSSDWSQSMTIDPFPFDSSGLPESVTMFLDPSDKVQSDHLYFTDLADSLTNGLTTQWEALTVLNGWVMDNIFYGTNPYGMDAYTTYVTGYGNCSNYAHIALALVRAAGIPARLVHGYSFSKPYKLPTGGEPIDASWGQGTHAWIEVYYPSLGWVPYDPQRDLHHVDTHRVLWGRGVDTTGIVGRTSYTSESAPSSYPAVYGELNVNWIDDSIDLSYIKSTSEISDFSLSSAVPVIQDHTINSSAGSGGSISPDGEIAVINGSSRTFSITPDSGYKIEDVLVDGTSQGSVSSYTFNNLSADHTISVQFLYEGSNDGGGSSGSSGSSCFINTIKF
ncbi:MAG: transglutaminase-like domain-containing protein [Desulfobacteraceae bacterium]|jgi:transglutaminase-like putative cysteine protease